MEIRKAILEALETYLHRLKNEFVGREEFNVVAQAGVEHGKVLEVLKSEFGHFRKDFSKFTATAEKLAWLLVSTIGGAIIIAVLGLVLV